MASPSSVIASPRADLREAIMEFDVEVNQRAFIASKILRPFSVPYQAGTFPKIKLASLLKSRNTSRAPGAGYARGQWEFETGSWVCVEQGAEEPVDHREQMIYADFFDAEVISTLRAVNAVLENAERRAAEYLYNTTTFSAQRTDITNEWDDYTNATPITDVHAARTAIWNRTGLWADTLSINRFQFHDLRNCAQVIDRIESSGAGNPTKADDITAEMLARVFDLKQVLVAGGAKDSAAEGQTPVVASIWSDEYAFLSVTAQSDDLREPCIGRTFHWDQDGGDLLGAIETYEEPQTRSTIVRCRHDVHENILFTAAGQLFTNVKTI